MHIPDAVLTSTPWGWGIGIAACIIAAILLMLSINWARKNLTRSKLVVLAVIAAGIFALQAFNLPTPFGVSGHLVGGALAAIVFGSPFAAIFVLSIVLVIQALMFSDGGVLALGLNIINMGVISGCIGFYSYKFATKKIPSPLSAGIAGWLACVIAACCCALELALVGIVPLNIGLPVMALYHASIGVIEGIITVIIIALIFKARPDLTGDAAKQPVELKKFLIAGIIIVLVIAVAAVLFASTNPDGLESTFLVATGQKEVFAPVIDDEVIGEESASVIWNAPMPDYALGNSVPGGILAVIIGVIIAIGAIVAIAFAAMKSRKL